MSSYEPQAKRVKFMKMVEKTPVSRLQEFCAQEKFAYPSYEFNVTADDSKKFVCYVHALNQMANGYGRSKIEAKHAACTEFMSKIC